ncbi:hypothetical protein Taro_048009 [Colocasia esculenta]|uniref:Uncharacterized protein n=1 Tax=Colocasia esculenta TaxID=4460 RepID=A0A843WWZ8_COLES|nr:hypothetical protein [Colocasia esculenta]
MPEVGSGAWLSSNIVKPFKIHLMSALGLTSSRVHGNPAVPINSHLRLGKPKPFKQGVVMTRLMSSVMRAMSLCLLKAISHKEGSRRDRLGCPETDNPTYDKMKARSLRHAYIASRLRSLQHSELLKVRSLRHAYITARPRSLRHSELLKARSLRHAYITARLRSLRHSELLKARSLRHTSLRHSELLKARSLRHAYIIARPRPLQHSELLKAWLLRHTYAS